MKYLLTIISCLLALNLSAQEVVVEYPYNPDFENDGNVGVEDLLQLLSSFGMAFEVGELTIDEVVLSEWLQTISETLIAQQAIIDSLSSLTSALDSAGVADLLSQANFGTSAGGFNPSYPVIRGTHDLRFNTAAGYSSYTVPTDSIFIIEHAAPSGYAGSLLINDIAVWTAGIGTVVDSRPQQQLYVGSGETVTSTQGITWNIHGYLVPNGSITPLTIAIPGQESYTVPAGKQFVISTINGDDTGSLQIDNVYRGSYSVTSVQAGLNELYVPLVCSSSTTLFMNNNPDKTARINGYLVDEDYFESTSPSVTSEAESLGLAFGERIHLSEPEDWGPFPLQPAQFHSGTYDFDQDGFCFGYFRQPIYSMHLLPDSISLDNISDDEFYEDYQVVSNPGGSQASFSIPLKAEEKIIIRGTVGAFDNNHDHNISWTPLESTATSVCNDSSLQTSDVASNVPQVGLQCVDFGGAPDCYGEEFAQGVSTNADDNYKYTLRSIQHLDGDDNITVPLWRKFQISNLPEDFTGRIKLRSFQWNYGSSGNFPLWDNRDFTLYPEISADGVFFWAYWNDYPQWSFDDCETSIFELIPEEFSINAWLDHGTDEFEIWFEGEGAYHDTGIRFQLGL